MIVFFTKYFSGKPIAKIVLLQDTPSPKKRLPGVFLLPWVKRMAPILLITSEYDKIDPYPSKG